VMETGGRIPRDPDHHVFPSGFLCLGSYLRLMGVAQETSGLTGFFRATLVPFLYAFSHGEATGEYFLFGELSHGTDGLRNDYASMLGLEDPQAVDSALRLLGMKKRDANKEECPCGCGRRLGVCSFNETVRDLRDRFGRGVLRQASRGLNAQPAGTATSLAPPRRNPSSEERDMREVVFSPRTSLQPPRVFN
jgi:hypothetical protein